MERLWPRCRKQAAVMPGFALQAGRGTSPPPAQPNLLRLFSLKHKFSSEWYKFLNPPDTALSQSMQIGLNVDRFPFKPHDTGFCSRNRLYRTDSFVG